MPGDPRVASRGQSAEGGKASAEGVSGDAGLDDAVGPQAFAAPPRIRVSASAYVLLQLISSFSS
jgi:hypothetical protein